MKIGFYNDFRPCIVTDNGVVDLTAQLRAVNEGSSQVLMENLIGGYEWMKARYASMAVAAPKVPLDKVQFRAPLPRPGKVLCGNANYMEGVKITPARPLQSFFKSPDAVIGYGDTVELPPFKPVIFNHEAELAAVIGKPAHNVSEAEALSYVFGYTTAIDVSARAPEEGEMALPGPYGKCFDTFLPIGPYIVTADEVGDPNNLHVQYWVNEELRQDYNTSDMEHSLAYVIATLSHIMTLKPGDLILAGTNHGNLGPLQDGDLGEIEIEKVGRNVHHVSDPMKRTWDPHALRDPKENAARREGMKSLPNPGTWPFQPKGG